MNRISIVIAGFASAVALCACSSTSTPITNRDAGGSGGTPVGGDGGAGGDDAQPPVGGACTSNADCVTSGDEDAGVSCSNATYSSGPVYPTPICVSTCTASGNADEIDVCGDGTGLCEPGATGDEGLCLPVCFVSQGSVITGCLANDTCSVEGTTVDAQNNPELFGACQPGCTASSQCPTGSSCDTFRGACVTTVTAPTEPFGSACNPATDTGCVCLGPTSGGASGFCSSVCVTGDACPVPPGRDAGTTGDASASSALPFVCSAQLGGINALDAGISFSAQPNGLFGYCFPSCDTTGDCLAYGASLSCVADPAGGAHLGICELQ